MGNVFNILRSLDGVNLPTDAQGFLLCIVASFLFSILIVLMYQFFFESRHAGSGVERAFPLIGPAVTAIFLGIQFSLPLSLGLLGALSFVRFRTPIKQPEELGYILLLIASSIGCATYNFLLVIILLCVVLVAYVLKQFVPTFFTKSSQRGLILISLKEESYQTSEKEIGSFIRTNLVSSKLESVSLTDGMASLFYRFDPKDIKQWGVLSKKLKDVANAEKVNIFLERGQGI